MKIRTCAAAVVMACMASAVSVAYAAVENPQPVKDLLNRIGGDGTAERFVTVVDDTYASASGAEMFKISARDGKPCITGTTLSAVTTGLGWYLNHSANVNIAWNNPHVTLGTLPVPSDEEEHTTAATYRYYLNYCTFSYSMSTWTWERWQEEIDWMALHGINMPLQIVGLEEVWRQFLIEDYGYTKAEANAFVGGPCFMAWFGMNNLQGHGGPNPDWWYERQAALGRKINERMRSLGIEPVLPGFAGMVPDNFTSKTGIAASGQGGWCGFTRPYIVDSTGEKFAEVASKYYARLKAVMGESTYYSIDPYHEGGAAPSNPGLGYQKMYNAMIAAKPDAKWVIQSWQWSGAQWTSLDNIPKGRLIVLDLYSDGKPNWGAYKGHDTVYSSIFNFGARTGFFGRFNGIINGYFEARGNSAVKGIGAAPEGIEQTPVMYDLLFELPWMSTKPDAAQWMAEYAKRRYSAESADAAEAWELLRTSALNCTSGLQGPHEAIVCARPNLTVNSVSTWGGSEIFYDQNKTATAAYKLLNANLSGDNYSYDLTDLVRQAITDYSKSLLAGIKEAHNSGNTQLFNKRRDAFLQLMLDIDELLNTNKDFMLGHWTERARNMADEVSGTTDADRNWLEYDNARTLISTWGPRNAAEGGGLHDYSYRQWGGMMKDYYYERWKKWFDNGMQAPSGGWFQWEWNWAHSNDKRYPSTPTGSTAEVARRILPKYLSPFTSKIAGTDVYYVPRQLTTDLKGKLYDQAKRGEAYTPDFNIAGTTISEIAIDMNRSTLFEADEIVAAESFAIPADAPIGERSVRLTLADGTVLTYTLKIAEIITEPRTVSVATADPAQGSVSIDGTDALTVNGTEFYVLRATPAQKYDFDHWTDATGANVGNDNPMTYYGKEDATFTAHFVENKWGIPETDYSDRGDIASYKQWVATMNVTQNGETTELYSTDGQPDEQFIYIPTRIKAAPGGEFTFRWTDAGGLSYLFLSAYIDLNADGTFDINSPELLGTLGKHEYNYNNDVTAGQFRVLLPYDTPKGTTHIRLRFDSSWFKPWDQATGAYAPDLTVKRYVYELLLDVNDAPEYTSKVTFGVNNPALGSIRSENATGLYLPGEEVIITAFPKAGARVVKWVDAYGRELPKEWQNDNSIRFKAFDNAHITAILEAEPMSFNGWTFNSETMKSGGLRLTEVIKEGEPRLDLSGENDIRSIAPTVFAGRHSLATVVLPDAELIEEGAAIHTARINGAGVHNAITTLDKTIAGSAAWVMYINGNTTANGYNEWGSALWGNGTDALADVFAAGWSQFYLHADNRLCVKWGDNTEHNFTLDLTGNFTIRSEFDGSSKLTVTLTNAAGATETQEITTANAMHDINQYACCIPEGMNLEIGFYELDAPQVPGELFAGCTVMDFAIPEENTAYKVIDGVVYDKAGKNVVAYPEGRLSVYPFTLGNSTKVAAVSPTQTGTSINDDDNLNISLTGTSSAGLSALWMLGGNPLATYDEVVHLNSYCGVASAGARVAKEAGKFGYELLYGNSGMPRIALTTGGKYLAAANGTLELQSAEASLKMRVTKTLDVVAPAADFAVVLPAMVHVPEGVECYYVTEVSADAGATLVKVNPSMNWLPARTPIIVRGAEPGKTVSFNIAVEVTTFRDENLDKNILRGKCVDLTYPGDYYLLENDGKFHLHTSGTIPANSAYLLKSDLPVGIGETFAIDGQSALVDIVGVGSAKALPLFDLQGRRVTSEKPVPGVYIDSEGHKILIR